MAIVERCVGFGGAGAGVDNQVDSAVDFFTTGTVAGGVLPLFVYLFVLKNASDVALFCR
jgi:hypothetical protein